MFLLYSPSESGSQDQYEEMVRKLAPGQYKVNNNYF